jgi:transcriptional regulator with XRE-family HTH domain
MNRFAKLVYDAVNRQKITYKKAAERSGVSLDLMSRIILGNRLPSPKNAIKIAKALGIDEEETLMAVNYDKVPKRAKKYFKTPEPKYPKIRKMLSDTYTGDRGQGKKLSNEIAEFSFGSLEMLILSRFLIGTAEYRWELINTKINTDKNLKRAKRIKEILNKPELKIDSEVEILDILSDISRWKIVGPDYSLQIFYKSPDGQEITIATGETAFEKPLISLTNSEPVEVPLPEDKIAAGVPLPISGKWSETRFFTESYLKKFKDPILVEVGEDQDSMIPVIFPGDLLLIDRRPVEKPKRGHIYAVNLDEGGSVKYCHVEDENLVITCENRFADFESVKMKLTDRLLNKIIVGEVVWVGRELPRK